MAPVFHEENHQTLWSLEQKREVRCKSGLYPFNNIRDTADSDSSDVIRSKV